MEVAGLIFGALGLVMLAALVFVVRAMPWRTTLFFLVMFAVEGFWVWLALLGVLNPLLELVLIVGWPAAAMLYLNTNGHRYFLEHMDNKLGQGYDAERDLYAPLMAQGHSRELIDGVRLEILLLKGVRDLPLKPGDWLNATYGIEPEWIESYLMPKLVGYRAIVAYGTDRLGEDVGGIHTLGGIFDRVQKILQETGADLEKPPSQQDLPDAD